MCSITRAWLLYTSGVGQNYLRSLLALGFQAFLIIVYVAIYAVLVQTIALEDDIIMAIWSCVGYTVLLCFTLFKTCLLYTSTWTDQPTQGRAASTAVPMPLWNISRVKSWRCATGRGFTKSTS